MGKGYPVASNTGSAVVVADPPGPYSRHQAPGLLMLLTRDRYSAYVRS